MLGYERLVIETFDLLAHPFLFLLVEGFLSLLECLELFQLISQFAVFNYQLSYFVFQKIIDWLQVLVGGPGFNSFSSGVFHQLCYHLLLICLLCLLVCVYLLELHNLFFQLFDFFLQVVSFRGVALEILLVHHQVARMLSELFP